MKKICKNCKYYITEAALCPHIKDIPEYCKHVGHCRCDKFVYGNDETTPYDGLSYLDYEVYGASFLVGESFGCIHFEEKKS